MDSLFKSILTENIMDYIVGQFPNVTGWLAWIVLIQIMHYLAQSLMIMATLHINTIHVILTLYGMAGLHILMLRLVQMIRHWCLA